MVRGPGRQVEFLYFDINTVMSTQYSKTVSTSWITLKMGFLSAKIVADTSALLTKLVVDNINFHMETMHLF